ncbi:MAG TPA: 50S ribosomal protein L22 [Candidatus Omnitrophica bacterium]|nr:50S ribosomal protein L22 [Candidatus Omnitrophota bacterium]
MSGKAVLRFAKISPFKLRQVTSLIHGKNVNDALSILQFVNKKGARIVEEVLKSAVANTSEKEDVDEDLLFVKEARVDEGPRWKRMRARARGGAGMLRKRTSHVTILLESIPRVEEREKKREKKR